MKPVWIKRNHIILGSIEAFVAVGAIPAGISMIVFPDGLNIGMSVEILQHSPFRSFMVPGLFLLIVNGLCNLAGAVLTFRRNRYSGLIGLGLGTLLCMWIVVQVYFIGLNSFLQPLYFFIGIAEILISYYLLKGNR